MQAEDDRCYYSILEEESVNIEAARVGGILRMWARTGGVERRPRSHRLSA